MNARPYDLLAARYDSIYRAERGRPLDLFAPLLREPLETARVACDLACGTGVLATALARRGLRVTAIDRHAGMLAVARDRARRFRARRARGSLRVVRADVRAFRLAERADLVTCLFDSLNHLPRHGDLDRVLRNAAASLRPGGWLVFDANTPRGVARVWPDPPLELRGAVRGRRWRAAIRGLAYDRARRRGGVEIAWRVGGARAEFERYFEIAWPARAIRRALVRAGFARIEAIDGSRVEAGLEPGLRTYWRARRNQSRGAGFILSSSAA